MKKENKKNYEECDDFESWEAEYYYLNTKDYEGLVKFREENLKLTPDDHYSIWSLGEAYNLNGEHLKALEFFTARYKDIYEDPNVEYSILNALFALGKNENDYQWIENPRVIRMKEAIEIGYNKIKRKIKYISANEFYTNVMIEGYLPFTEQEMYESLLEDERFDIVKADEVYNAKMKVKKGYKR